MNRRQFLKSLSSIVAGLTLGKLLPKQEDGYITDFETFDYPLSNKQVAQDYQRLVIRYKGHIVKEGFIMPDGEVKEYFQYIDIPLIDAKRMKNFFDFCDDGEPLYFTWES